MTTGGGIMLRVGISDFKITSRYYFDINGKFESMKYQISHYIDQNGIEVELDDDNILNLDDIFTDLMEWAFKLGRESKKL